jgi:chaperonin GroES
MQPLNDRVMVVRDPAVTEAEAGIVIPEIAQRKTLTGTVKAIAPRVVERTGLKEGDRVYFGHYSGTEIVLEEGEFLMLREEDILAVEVKGLARAASS